MLEIEHSKPIDTAVLLEFFGRCGWDEPAAAAKLEWAMAASDQWVACKLDGRLVGFARSCRLGPLHRIVFDALVDPHFRHSNLRAQIIQLLAMGAGGFERVLVYGGVRPLGDAASLVVKPSRRFYAPQAPVWAYTGRKEPEPLSEG